MINKSSICSVLYIVAIQLLLVRANFNATELCALIANGTKIKDPSACNKWIECMNHTAITYACAAEQFYDRNTGECVPAQSIPCISSNPCAPLLNGSGFVPDPYSCSNYYYCKANSPSRGSCSEGWNYNSSSMTCVYNSTCQLGLPPNSYCNIVPDGVFIKVAENCQDYQLCWKDELLNGSCTASLKFDAFHGICTDRFIPECDDNANATTTATASGCKNAGDFISDEKTCNGYYYCMSVGLGKFRLVSGTCGSGRFFESANNGMCIPRTQMVCPYDRCAGFGMTNIQLCNLSNDGCKGYAVCQSGQEIGTGICPDNQYFDEIIQRCTSHAVSFAACAINTNSTTISPTTTTATTIKTK